LAAAGVRLPDALVGLLVERTEGWPAGLYLAALSLRGRVRPEDFVDRFTGTSRHVADFLSEDVLARQPDAVIGFLLHTCILEELTASLCEALTGGTDAEEALRELERSNLFVVPLDEERLAWRYHHLFAQYLRAELARREPELVPELHRRAWRWYREHGLVGRAVAHAQTAGDVEVAAELVAAHYSAMAQGGQIETVRSWLAGFDDARIEGHAPLAVVAAWVSALSGGTRAGRPLRRGGPAGILGRADARWDGLAGGGAGHHVQRLWPRQPLADAQRRAAGRQPGAADQPAWSYRVGGPGHRANAGRRVRVRTRSPGGGGPAGRGDVGRRLLPRPSGADQPAGRRRADGVRVTPGGPTPSSSSPACAATWPASPLTA
jgi:hypothetical protein